MAHPEIVVMCFNLTLVIRKMKTVKGDRESVKKKLRKREREEVLPYWG